MWIYVYTNIYTYRHEGEMLRMKGSKKKIIIIIKYKNQNLRLTVKDNCIQPEDRPKCHNVTDSALRFPSPSNI